MRLIKSVLILASLIVVSCDNRKDNEGGKLQSTDRVEAKVQQNDRIVDEIDLLKSDEEQRILKSIQQLQSETGSQLAIVLIDSLRDNKLNDYGQRTIQSLKLGNDGAVILVVWWPRDISVHVGQGLKGIITDQVANNISDVEMEKIFTQNDFEGGLSFAVERINELIKKQKSNPTP